jgi:CheY-like chemotaxis protein
MHGTIDDLARSTLLSPKNEMNGNLRILVVDDNQDAADMLAMMLRLSGHTTDVAYDGLDAVQKAESARPDVALLDIGLPRLDGYEAARRIRAHEWGRAIRLVALTGWGDDEDKRKALDAGFDDHLIKPVEFEKLDALLGQVRR